MSPRGGEGAGATDGVGAVSGERAEWVGRVVREVGGGVGAGAVGGGATATVGAERTGMVAEVGAAGTLLEGAAVTTLLTEVAPPTDVASPSADALGGAAAGTVATGVAAACPVALGAPGAPARAGPLVT
jgi:hypothetical protein